MQQSSTTAQLHKSPPAKVHHSGRRHRSQSRHERHKCHKHRRKLEEEKLHTEISQLRNENYLLSKRINASTTSLDSGLPNTDALPYDLELRNTCLRLKRENIQLVNAVKLCKAEYEKCKQKSDKDLEENSALKQDTLMLKNLVFRLNMELEKFQDIRDKVQGDSVTQKKKYQLPKYYNKNFLKPLLPLLRAYTEVIEEKKEIITHLELKFENFSLSFNDLLKENEVLYKELEIKRTQVDDNIFDELKTLRKNIDLMREEKEIYCTQAKMEGEKLKEVHALYKTKVSLLEKEKEVLFDKIQDARSELCTLKGKQTVLKQELDRLRSEDETKVPMAVHSASISECKRIFQDFRHDNENEKQQLLFKLKECETKVRMKEEELRKDNEERLNLEQGNFDLTFENDTLKRRIADLESQNDGDVGISGPRAPKEDLHVKKQLKNAKKKNSDLEGKLQKTKKQLQQTMAFAEDIVREQEGLLAQLHEKQKENNLMITQFGSLKSKLKIVEKNAQEGLNTVENKMKTQEEENVQLANEVERLHSLLLEKEITLDDEEIS